MHHMSTGQTWTCQVTRFVTASSHSWSSLVHCLHGFCGRSAQLTWLYCYHVIVDKLSKYAHFLPLAHPFTALQVAQLYFDQIYRLHGLPKAIISDRDKIFTSTIWQTLFKLSDTALLMSSSYHPQTDGQTERLNQCLETFLRCLVSSCPRKWKDYLPLAQFWYNTTMHSALGRSPFEVLYGHPPRMLGITPGDAYPDIFHGIAVSHPFSRPRSQLCLTITTTTKATKGV